MYKIGQLIRLSFVTIFLSIAAVQAANTTLLTSTFPKHESSKLSTLHFEPAKLQDREFLINFAIQSNDIYETRTANEEMARMVFDIPENTFVNGFIEILKLDEDIVGFFSLTVQENEGNETTYALEHLFVKAGLQGNGFGTALFQRVVEIAKREEWKRLEWLCDPDAAKFYLKMGATIMDPCENLLNPGIDLPIFEYYTDTNLRGTAKAMKMSETEHYLGETIKYLIQHWYDAQTGIVACAIIDGDRTVYAVSSQNGKHWIHAERNAYNRFKSLYGNPGPNATFITTLSPCVSDLKRRSEPSCSDLIKKLGIKKMHFGVLDTFHVPSISSYKEMEFIPTVTQNEAMAKICKKLMGMFTEYDSRINTELPAIKKELGNSFFSDFLEQNT